MAELNPASQLRKTEAGLLAIKERDRSLLARARTLLIMVDGTKTVAQLAAMNSDVAQGMELLAHLEQLGFVAVVTNPAAAPGQTASATAAPAAPAAAAAPVATAGTPARAPERDLRTSIRMATKFLEGWMGPGSEPLCLQLERCKTPVEFEAKVQEIRVLLATARSVKKAEEFSIAALGA
jgi:hypothetical protein